MKKILSIAAVLVLLLTLTVPVFAAEVNYPSVSNGEIAATSDDGTPVEVTYANPADVNEGNLKLAIGDAGIVPDDNYGVDVFEANALDGNGNKAERNDPITITFWYENADLVIGALIQNADESWTSVPFTVDGNWVTVYLPHLTPIAMVLKAEAAAPSTPTVPEASGSHQSPFTGDYTVIWAAAAVVMALCAGAFFMSARKRNAE